MKASEFIKRIFLILLCLILIFSFSSCSSDLLLSKSNFQDINFTETQKVQLSLNGNIYNLHLSFGENNNFTLNFADEISDSLKNLKLTVTGDLATIENDGIVYTKNINDFNNNFFPKIIYLFFKNTNLKKELFYYNKDENSLTMKNEILEKTVVLTVRLTKDKNNQIYLIEIR